MYNLKNMKEIYLEEWATSILHCVKSGTNLKLLKFKILGQSLNLTYDILTLKF